MSPFITNSYLPVIQNLEAQLNIIEHSFGLALMGPKSYSVLYSLSDLNGNIIENCNSATLLQYLERGIAQHILDTRTLELALTLVMEFIPENESESMHFLYDATLIILHSTALIMWNGGQIKPSGIHISLNENINEESMNQIYEVMYELYGNQLRVFGLK